MPPPPPPATAGSRAAEAHPCLRTHGKEVARLHLLDWIVLVLLVAMYAVLGLVQPFHRFVAEDMMTTLRYPMKGNTVPSWAVPIIAIVVPMVFFIGIYMKRRNVYDLHHGILGVLFSVLITAILTVAIKDAVGRPRPDFFWRCFPDGVPNYNNITGDVICHGNPNVIKEGHKSFPSGHASGSFAGLGFLSWYLAGKIKVFDRRGHVAKLCIVLVPLLLASMVAVSRVSDYWHHWQDVFAGGILGLVVATLCYLQFFPLPYSEHELPDGNYALVPEAEEGGADAELQYVEVSEDTEDQQTNCADEDVPDGSYTLVPADEDEGAGGDVHYVSVDQDPDQSPEVCLTACVDEGNACDVWPEEIPLGWELKWVDDDE